MENENQTLPTNNPVDGNQSVNNQPTPTPAPLAEQPKIETPVMEKPKAEPIRIGQQIPPPPVAPPPVAPPSVVAQPVATQPTPPAQPENQPTAIVVDKTKVEAQWLNKAKPGESKVEELKKDLAVEGTVTTKFKTALERLKAKRIEFKNDFPIIYWWAFAGVVITTICLGLWLIYYFFFYEKDYLIKNEKRCDPYTEKCFIWQCDPTDTGEDKCTGNPKEDTVYYKYEQRMNSKVPYCDPASPACLPFECEEGEKNCGEVFCTEDNEDGVDCIDPETFSADNPKNAETLKAEAEASAEEDTVDENFPDEVIPNEQDTAEDLQAEQDALQSAENNIKNGN